MMPSASSNPGTVTEYFTGLASTYAAHRPNYPQESIQWLFQDLRSNVQVADIGCGTGISTRLLAQYSGCVIGIDPNDDMLAQARRATAPSLHVEYRRGTGEHTGLPDASVDLVVCAQSFHWFDAAAALAEFWRILRTHGRLALMWNWKLTGNEGDEKANPFSRAFTRLMHAAQADAARRGMQVPSEREADPTIGGYFCNVRRAQFPNPQSLDEPSMLGRAHSASYFPKSGPVRDQLDFELIEAFRVNQRDGRVVLNHMTQVTLADRV